MTQKNTEAKRLSADRLEKAKDGLVAIGQLSNYDPRREEFNSTRLAAVTAALKAASEAELNAANALDKARDKATAAEWEAYNFYLGAAEQVIGQYGSDSDEYASLGYKKRSEYKKTAPGKKNMAG